MVGVQNETYMNKKVIKQIKKRRIMSPTRQIILSFLLVILIGAVLLSLPISNRMDPLPFMDQLFVATSVTCVTGLLPVTIVDQYTIWGQLVILVLIQIGGLGFLTFLYVLLSKIQKKLSLRQKIVLQEMLNQSSISDSSLMIRRILSYTFVVETIGILLFMLIFIPEYGVLKGVYYSVYHGISSFTNAGIDVLGTTSLMSYQTHSFLLFVTAGLVILGGIGFMIWFDILQSLRSQRNSAHSFSFRRFFLKLGLHSKIVIVMSAFLIVSATFILFFAERNNPQTIGNLSVLNQLQNSFFLSVSSRTAGFTTFPITGLHMGTKLILWIYMFIGGSPASTAGGIKTTTFMITLLMVYNIYKGKKEVHIFGRRIPKRLMIRSFAILSMAFVAIFTALVIVSFSEEAPLFDLAVEVISAFTTVGFSHQVTPTLSFIGRMTILTLMFIGRVGPITMLISFVSKSYQQKEKKEIGYPNGELLLG
jgi:trk system potassium uptake protein TrkH